MSSCAAVLHVSMVEPSLLRTLRCSVESASRVKSGSVLSKGAARCSLRQESLPPRGSTCVVSAPCFAPEHPCQRCRRAGCPKVPVRADLLLVHALQVTTSTAGVCGVAKADIQRSHPSTVHVFGLFAFAVSPAQGFVTCMCSCHGYSCSQDVEFGWTPANMQLSTSGAPGYE